RNMNSLATSNLNKPDLKINGGVLISNRYCNLIRNQYFLTIFKYVVMKLIITMSRDLITIHIAIHDRSFPNSSTVGYWILSTFPTITHLTKKMITLGSHWTVFMMTARSRFRAVLQLSIVTRMNGLRQLVQIINHLHNTVHIPKTEGWNNSKLKLF
ncbi:hypothetical protein L9F63_021301, partial [Diploptera punctata]